MEDSNRKIEVMGIINITDNSYYAASRHLEDDGTVNVAAAKADIATMLAEGADMIDLGACSTRPGAAAVGENEEWRRLEPVLDMIGDNFPGIKVSVDTYWASVVEKAYEILGNRLIVNDVYAGSRDPRILELTGRLNLKYIAMHNCGETTAKGVYPNGVVQGVCDFFEDFAARAEANGISDWVLDPGFGFSKTVEENWELLENMHLLKKSYRGYTPKILVGISRKSMIYKPLGITPEESLPATCKAHLLALEQGADILRVHDVAPARKLIREGDYSSII